MTTALLITAVASQLCLVTGQLLMKHAMNQTNLTPVPWARFAPRFALGVAALSAWFFLWGGLLQRADLSYLFPFEGLSPVLIVFGAALFLKERLTPQSWFGIVLIGAGVAVVSAS
ncbi:MAG: EamA family transporter [Verrucomicrobia bacterium]|nr:EamA family transporter [Verrucomicrobiota bacterium]